MDTTIKQALRQQRAEGFTIGEIARNFGLAKSTVYPHVRNVTPQLVAPTLSPYGDELSDRVAEFVFNVGLELLSQPIEAIPYRVADAEPIEEAHRLASWNGKKTGYILAATKDGFAATFFSIETEEPTVLTLTFTERR